jgi:hypothetical protein
MRFFRRWPVDQDPEQLLDPANQVSTPWGASDHGPCDKCSGAGNVGYRCRSCVELGARDDCPACAGRVEFEDICPACEGNGEIDRTKRDGVSVFPSLEGLRRYLVERDVDLSGCDAVVLDGDLTGDRDLDADTGALLIRPRRVLGICPLQ